MSDAPSGDAWRLRPEELTEDQRALYDDLVGGPRAQANRASSLVDAEGRLSGPFNAMLHAPAVGGPLQRLGAALRYESSLADDVREGVICLVAGVHEASYERYAHERLARAAGVTDEVLQVLARGELPPAAGPELQLAHALLTGSDPDEEPMVSLGPKTVFEVSSLVGYYTTLAWQLRLFGVEAPDE